MSGTELTNYDTITNDGEQYYRFVYSNIAAKQMGDVLTAVLYAERDGETLQSAPDVYSVKTYAYNRLEKSTNSAFKKLMVDMLNYGAAAQLYFNYDTDNLVNAELTAEQEALGTQGTPTLTSVEDSVPLEGTPTAFFRWKNVGFQNSIALRYSMEFAEMQDTENVKLVLTYKTAVGTTVKKTIMYSEFEDGDSGQKYGTIYTIAAKDLSETITAKIYDGDTQISDTITYSIETYVYNRLRASDDESFKLLITELMKYGKSAKAYFMP